MADLNSPARHRLELLERTIYALQAQQRLVEYRVQYLEQENQTLRQNMSPKSPQATGASGGRALFQPTPTPRVSKHNSKRVALNLTSHRRSPVTNLTFLSFRTLQKSQLPESRSMPERYLLSVFWMHQAC